MEFNEMFEIKPKAETEKSKFSINKHILYRLGFLLIGTGLIYGGCSLIDEREWLLAALYINFFFLVAWLFFLAIEALVLYFSKKQLWLIQICSLFYFSYSL